MDNAKNKALHAKMGNEETPERQEANRILRKGMKRPEHGNWPVASEKMIKGIAWHKSKRTPKDMDRIFGKK